jgi:PAS domain S-box-containing protein
MENILPGSISPVPCGCACEALDLLQQIYQTAPVAMLAVDPDLLVTRLNQRFADFAGQSFEQLLGKSLDTILAQAHLSQLVARVIKTLQPLLDHEITFLNRDHETTWVVNAYPITSENRLSSVNLIINDISQLRSTQKKLETAYQSILELQEKLEQENQLLRREISHSAGEQSIIGSSPAIKNVLDQIRQVASTETTVLITGETGTGKELVARALHLQSHRKQSQLIIVNCAALPANLIESELFGHEKGAFTGAIARKTGKFELADGGTVFLDEIGELPLELQSKLLRVLQESQFERVGGVKPVKVDVRVIAATNRDLAAEVRAQRFREDLFFRLNVFPIFLPALKDRGVDVIEIADAFISFFAERMGRHRPRLAKESIQTLLNYEWPGNIRELRNVIERGMILCKSDTISITIPDYGLKKAQKKDFSNFNPDMTLIDVEKAHITSVLEKLNWKVRGFNGAAFALGLKPTTLESKMKKLGIKRPKPL